MTTEEQNLDQFVISEVAFVAPGQDDNMAFTTDFGNLDYVSGYNFNVSIILSY